jgi:hypothetical protein
VALARWLSLPVEMSHALAAVLPDDWSFAEWVLGLLKRETWHASAASRLPNDASRSTGGPK